MTRREWCAALAKFVSPSFPAEAQEALLAMLPAMQHLPDTLFTPATVLEVAGVKRRQSIPAWDEIMGALNAYRRTYLPDPTLRLAAPSRDPEERLPPSPEEVAIVQELVASIRADAALREIERDTKPFRDVTLKGDALIAVRRSRGLFCAAAQPEINQYGDAP